MISRRDFPDSGPARYAPEEEVSAERQAAESALCAIPGVRGIGEGNDEIGDPAWIAYISDTSVARSLPSAVAGRKVVVQVTGEIDILPT